MYVLHGFLSAVTYCTDEDPLPGEVRMIDSISPSNLLQEEWTSDTIVLFVCELDGTIDMPLQSRLIASGFPMPFPIGCNDGVRNVAAQEAVPSIKAASRAFGIFQLSRHH